MEVCDITKFTGNVRAKDIFKLPNLLCCVRIFLVPIFIYSFLYASEPKDYYMSSLILLLSGATDIADGFIARRFNMITELGIVLDPLADKLTQAAVLVCLMLKIKYMYILVILFTVKELTMGISSLLLLKRGTKLDGAKWFGKVSTSIFYLTMLILVAVPYLKIFWINTLMITSGAFLMLSFLLYMQMFIKMLFKKNDENSHSEFTQK